MTTIAYKDGIIAYDSRTTSADIITNDHANKGRWIEDCFFVFSGSLCDYDQLVELYFGRSDRFKHIEASAVVYDKSGQLWFTSIDANEGLWKERLDLDTARAYGSGTCYALTAMDCGRSAVQAVRMAALRDCKTGGQVRYFDVETRNLCSPLI
jgi:20S proteasome alpha/beta subunit